MNPFLIVAMTTLGILGSVTGCSRAGDSSPPRFPVQGTVKLDGDPLPEGRITFRSLDSGLANESPIHNGQFSGKVVPGAQRVEVSVVKLMKPTGPPIPGMPDAIPSESLPAKFNSESQLTATVSADRPNEFEFELRR